MGNRHFGQGKGDFVSLRSGRGIDARLQTKLLETKAQQRAEHIAHVRALVGRQKTAFYKRETDKILEKVKEKNTPPERENIILFKPPSPVETTIKWITRVAATLILIFVQTNLFFAPKPVYAQAPPGQTPAGQKQTKTEWNTDMVNAVFALKEKWTDPYEQINFEYAPIPGYTSHFIGRGWKMIEDVARIFPTHDGILINIADSTKGFRFPNLSQTGIAEFPTDARIILAGQNEKGTYHIIMAAGMTTSLGNFTSHFDPKTESIAAKKGDWVMDPSKLGDPLPENFTFDVAKKGNKFVSVTINSIAFFDGNDLRVTNLDFLITFEGGKKPLSPEVALTYDGKPVIKDAAWKYAYVFAFPKNKGGVIDAQEVSLITLR